MRPGHFGRRFYLVLSMPQRVREIFAIEVRVRPLVALFDRP